MAEENEEEQPQSSGGGAGKLMVLMAGMNLLAVAGIGAYLITSQSNAQGGAAPIAMSATSGRILGALVELKPLVVNLNVVGATRYLKVSVQVELPQGKSPEEFEPLAIPVRHRMLVELSSLTVEDTQGAEKKLKLQEDLRDKINEMMGPNTVTRVLFTEFVVQ